MRASTQRPSSLRYFLALLPSVAALAVVVFAGSIAAPTVRADDESETSDQDLQGILPGFIPGGITDADFAELNGTWAEWAEQTGLLVIDFYSSDDPAVRGRRATLEQLQRRVMTMELALADPRYAGIHLQLADFHSRLAPRVAIMGALLDTIELDVSAHAQSRQQAAVSQLAADAQVLEAYLRGIPKGEAWLPYLEIPSLLAAAQSAAINEELAALMDRVQLKLARRTALDDSQREFLSAEPVLAFEDSLAAARAAMAPQDPNEYREQMRSRAADLLLALEEYEEAPLSVHTRAIRTVYDDIRRIAPDGGARLTEQMRRHYLNYNTRLMVDESLVQTLFSESRFESGFINDMSNNVHVSGCQWTSTHAGLDIRPSADGVRFDLRLDGNVRARMKGDTHLATVYIAGYHVFHGRKEVFFDGDHFHTRPARVSVSANNQPTGARTKFSPLPILGRISENVAVREARKQLPDANAKTRQKIYREAKPRFDREADQNFYEAELELERKVNGPMREQGLYADVKQFTSSETDMMARTRLMESGEIGGAATFPLAVYPAHGILMQFHESMLNNAAERFDLEAKTFTPDELKDYLTERLERLLGRKVDLSNLLEDKPGADQANQEKVEAVVFAEEDAVRVQLEGGRIKLFLRIGLNMEGRDPIPPQSISIELYPTLVGDSLHIEAGETIGVDAIEAVPPGERLDQITRANVMRSKMQDLFEPQDLETVYTFELQKKSLKLRLTDLKLRGGWVSAVLTDGVSQSPSAPPEHAAAVPPAAPPLIPGDGTQTVVLLESGNDGPKKATILMPTPPLQAPVLR